MREADEVALTTAPEAQVVVTSKETAVDRGVSLHVAGEVTEEATLHAAHSKPLLKNSYTKSRKTRKNNGGRRDNVL